METPTSDRFDRSYVYDHVGRLTEAKSGTEAHTPSVTTNDRPYNETFGFDQWNNLTARTGRVWTDEMLGVSTTYTNNRRQGWTYDADGRPTVQNHLSSEYDASGRKIKTVDSTPRGKFFPLNLTIRQGFDGDGQRLKQQENGAASTYLIRSSVLGEVVSEIGYVNSTWQKKTGFVYGAGRMLATQTIGLYGGQTIVTWRYQNPVTGSQRGLEPTELDPLGLDAGIAPPDGGANGSEASDMVFPRYGDIMNGSTGCEQDGAMASCDTVMFAIDSGAATQCLNNDCGPHLQTINLIGYDGQVVDSQTRLILPGQRGWDGSDDGRYLQDQPAEKGGIHFDWNRRIFNRVPGSGNGGFLHHTPQNPVGLGGDQLRKYLESKGKA